MANALIRSYTLDPATATATFVASIPSTVPGAADVADRRRLQPGRRPPAGGQRGNENFRINPNNGALSGDDVNLTYTAPATGPVTAVAYDRNVAPGPPGTIAPPGTLTTLYGIDVGADRLVTIGGVGAESPGGPNGGTVRPRARSPWRSTTPASRLRHRRERLRFRVADGRRAAGLYRVNLAGGTATLIGALPAEVRA